MSDPVEPIRAPGEGSEPKRPMTLDEWLESGPKERLVPDDVDLVALVRDERDRRS